MKTAAKILCIIALIFGLIWATVGFFGSWVGGAVIATGEEVFANDSVSADATMGKSVNFMLKFIGSFIVVIIGGVLGIVGSKKAPSQMKPIILGILTYISGWVLFPLNNYVVAAIYLVAGLLLVLAGLTTKIPIENQAKEDEKRKKMMLALISIGVMLLVTIGGCFMLTSSPKKQIDNTNETTNKGQVAQSERVISPEEQVTQSEQVMSPEDCFEQGEKNYYDDKNYTEAEKWYRKSAEQGYAPAQYELGAMYYYDAEKGIKQDFSEALKWFKKSAEQNNADAQLGLGHMYYSGEGVTENLSEALKWYRKSAEQGEKYAQYRLGQMYEYGEGIPQNYDKAIEWYQKASDQGHEKASVALRQLLGEFYGVEYEE